MKEIAELERLWVDHKSHMARLPILEYPYPAILEKQREDGVITEKLLAEVVDYFFGFSESSLGAVSCKSMPFSADCVNQETKKVNWVSRLSGLP